MAEDQQDGTQQGSEGTEDQGTQQGSGSAGAGQQTTEGFPPEVQAILDKANAEAAKARKAAAALQKRLETIEQGQLSEQEKLANRNKELEGTVQTLQNELMSIKTQAAVGTVATRLGFVNPALAHRLVDPKEIAYDDDGKPTNIEALLKEIAKTDPYLVGRARTGDAGQGQGNGPAGRTMNDLLRQATGRG